MAGRKEGLDDLITAFGCALHEDHPNPERVGCPGRPALTALAKESEPAAGIRRVKGAKRLGARIGNW
jgi:hypothetical protein